MPNFNFLSQFVSEKAGRFQSEVQITGLESHQEVKKVPLNFWGRVSYYVFISNYRPMTHHLTTIHERDQPTKDIMTWSIAQSKCFFLKIKLRNNQNACNN